MKIAKYLCGALLPSLAFTDIPSLESIDLELLPPIQLDVPKRKTNFIYMSVGATPTNVGMPLHIPQVRLGWRKNDRAIGYDINTEIMPFVFSVAICGSANVLFYNSPAEKSSFYLGTGMGISHIIMSGFNSILANAIFGVEFSRTKKHPTYLQIDTSYIPLVFDYYSERRWEGTGSAGLVASLMYFSISYGFGF